MNASDPFWVGMCQLVKFFKRNFFGELSYADKGAKIHGKDFISDLDVVCFGCT